MELFEGRQFSRRQALSLGGLALGASAIGGLAGCRTGGTEPVAPQGSGPLPLPSVAPVSGINPDFKASLPGGIEGFLKYPKESAVQPLPAPGGGLEVGALLIAGGTPPPLDSNTFWQQLNKNLDCNLAVESVVGSDFTAKVAAVIAGGDSPDFLQIPPDLATNLPQLLQAQFADLTPHLAGDAIKEYPYLANLPEAAWRGCIFNGKIQAIPSIYRLLSNSYIIRGDLVEKHGLNGTPSSADELYELFTAFKGLGSKNFAGTAQQLLLVATPMFGVPNQWRQNGDSFVASIETPEYKDALAWIAKLWTDGLLHPNSFQGAPNLGEWFCTGEINTFVAGGLGYRGIPAQARTLNSEATVGFLPIPKAAGGGVAPGYTTNGITTLTAIKKADDARIKTLLGIANYLAAPLGTPEYLFLNYGTEGTHFSWDSSGNPIRNKQGDSEILANVVYIARPPMTLFNPADPYLTEGDWNNEKVVLANPVPPGNLGLYSPTEAQKSASLMRNVIATQWDVVQGRATMEQWDAVVEKWRTEGGNQIREELIAAKEASQ